MDASSAGTDGSITANSTNSSPNLSSPYYLHPNENPALVLVNPILTGLNYHTWSRAMRVALQSKNKLVFVDGTIQAPSSSSSSYSSWLQCNTMVCSWLLRAISPTIAQSILGLDKASDIWLDLRDRFAQIDVLRVAELQDEIFTFRQGALSVSDYYTKLKIFWDEYMILRPISRCSCNFICVCEKYREADYTLRFLKGLNERFAPVKSQIMLIDPLPSVNRVFSMLIQQERETLPPIGMDPVVLFNKGPVKPTSSNSVSFTGRGSGSVGTDGSIAANSTNSTNKRKRKRSHRKTKKEKLPNQNTDVLLTGEVIYRCFSEQILPSSLFNHLGIDNLELWTSSCVVFKLERRFGSPIVEYVKTGFKIFPCTSRQRTSRCFRSIINQKCFHVAAVSAVNNIWRPFKEDPHFVGKVRVYTWSGDGKMEVV